MRSLTELESCLLGLASRNHKKGWRSKKNDGVVQHHALWDALRKRIGGR